MKKVIFCIVLLGSVIAFSSPAFSQSQNGNQNGQGNGGQGREADYVKFKTDLSLTDVQVTSWQNLDEKYKPQMKAIRSNTALSEEDKKTQMKQLHASKETDLKAILSADQYTKLETLRSQQKGGGGNHNH
jgi:protein CpxP